MPIISNTEKNITFEINLLCNQFLDIDESRSDYENWIPFEMFLKTFGENYSYTSDLGATFTLYEIKNMILGFENIINTKRNVMIDRFSFCSSERFFDLIISDPLEERLLDVEIWIIIGVLTNGVTYGYDKGFRFVVNLDDFNLFTNQLKQQLLDII